MHQACIFRCKLAGGPFQGGEKYPYLQGMVTVSSQGPFGDTEKTVFSQHFRH